ncbi:mCG148339 [Mus musculus]|nr:mCG148339 [Mus musculus]
MCIERRKVDEHQHATAMRSVRIFWARRLKTMLQLPDLLVLYRNVLPSRLCAWQSMLVEVRGSLVDRLPPSISTWAPGIRLTPSGLRDT